MPGRRQGAPREMRIQLIRRALKATYSDSRRKRGVATDSGPTAEGNLGTSNRRGRLRERAAGRVRYGTGDIVGSGLTYTKRGQEK